MNTPDLTKEEILQKQIIGKDVFVAAHNVRLFPYDEAIRAMQIFANQEKRKEAIEFFKWNAKKVSEYLDYLKRVHAADGISWKEIELNTFENASISDRYNLFIEDKRKKK